MRKWGPSLGSDAFAFLKKLNPSAQRLAYSASQGLRVARYLSQAITANVFLGRKPSDEQKKDLPSLKDLLGDLVDLFRKDLANIP